ncbi:MAG: hypothetical protein AB1540_15680 [Bdellovibrionota bacterium]
MSIAKSENFWEVSGIQLWSEKRGRRRTREGCASIERSRVPQLDTSAIRGGQEATESEVFGADSPLLGHAPAAEKKWKNTVSREGSEFGNGGLGRGAGVGDVADAPG